jgi:hypothetical protein
MPTPRMMSTRPYVISSHINCPDSQVNPGLIYRILKSGAVPHVSAGNRWLFNADAMDAYLANGEPEQQPEIGKIRSVQA